MSADHDPLCPDSDPYRWLIPTDFYGNSMSCRCAEYARVRADERAKARQRVEACCDCDHRWGSCAHDKCAAAAGGDA